MQKLSDEQIYAAIKSGFKDFQYLARAGVKKAWVKMTVADRYAAGRALANIGDVARSPEKYFSRENTQKDWQFRLETYSREHNLELGSIHALYFVYSPMDIVWDDAVDAFKNNPDLHRQYYNFCKAVQNWEYDRTSRYIVTRENAYKFADKIVRDAQNLAVLAQIQKSNPLVRPLKRMVYSVQR